MPKSFIAHAISNVFQNPDSPAGTAFPGFGGAGGRRPDRTRMIVGNERSLLASIYTRLAIDAAMVNIRHCKVNEEDQFVELVNSYMNDCLTTEANLDQNAQALILDIVMTTLDKGVAVIVPIDEVVSARTRERVDIKTMRVGHVLEFMAKHVRVSVWDENVGMRREITVEKRKVGIVENPFYAVMNEPNSTLQRLNRKLALLDMSDNKVNSGKLDLLIQFPFQVRGDRKEQDAARRIELIEQQINNSQIGVAYVDATEKVIQLNRSVENKLLEQVKQLRLDLFSELGLTPEILNGTAEADALVNYISRTLEPILTAITQEMKRKFLTRTARTQGHTVKYFPNLFKLIPLKELAEIADKLSRNEIVTGNEFRSFLGLPPSKDPKADALRNPNIPSALDGTLPPGVEGAPDAAPAPSAEDEEVSKALDDFDAQLGALLDSLPEPEPSS